MLINYQPYRKGTILIIVAGISGLLASLALAFVIQVENSTRSDRDIINEAQARIMLTAACNYIQETSRIGWEPAGLQRYHLETFGWIDVRDGAIGPKVSSVPATVAQMRGQTTIPSTPYTGGSASNFPVGKARRCPMYVMQRPPYAIQSKVGYNLVPSVSTPTALLTTNPDPLPVGNTATFSDWVTNADKSPRLNSYGTSWFRLLREASGSVFLVTCGAGGSLGWKDWNEISAPTSADVLLSTPIERSEALAYFINEDGFKAAQRNEIRRWYRLEWNPAVTGPDHQIIFLNTNSAGASYNLDSYRLYPINALSNDTGSYGSDQRDDQIQNDWSLNGKNLTQRQFHNMGGTIQWIQRLRVEPENW